MPYFSQADDSYMELQYFGDGKDIIRHGLLFTVATSPTYPDTTTRTSRYDRNARSMSQGPNRPKRDSSLSSAYGGGIAEAAVVFGWLMDCTSDKSRRERKSALLTKVLTQDS